MKLKIKYPTTETISTGPSTHRYVYREVELQPVRILRSSCGTGAAASRYYYQADFVAPNDAAFAFSNGLIRTNIERKWNPKFNPKKLDWTGNICEEPYKAE